jgi:hypothetical protein
MSKDRFVERHAEVRNATARLLGDRTLTSQAHSPTPCESPS